MTTIRVERAKLERLAEIAAKEHRTLAQMFRVLVEREIARADAEAAA